MLENAEHPIHPLDPITLKFARTVSCPEVKASATSNDPAAVKEEPAQQELPRLTLAQKNANASKQRIGTNADARECLERVMRHEDPVEHPLGALAARLNDAQTLCIEMLPSDFGRLLNRLFHVASEVIEAHGGIIAQNAAPGLLGYFLLAGQSAKDPVQLIDCALALKERMLELGREWKIRTGWLHDLALNIGLHAASEYVGTLHTALGDRLMAFGNCMHVAECLSALGRRGQIWATKSYINSLAAQSLSAIKFGILRQENQRPIFIPNCFAPVGDAARSNETYGDFDPTLAALPVAQIFDRQG